MADTSFLSQRLVGFLSHHVRNATGPLQSYLDCVRCLASGSDNGLVMRKISFLRSVGEFLAQPDNKLFVADGTRPMFTTSTIPQEDVPHNPEAASITVRRLTEQLQDKFDLAKFTNELSPRIDTLETQLAKPSENLNSVREFANWFDASIKSLD